MRLIIVLMCCMTLLACNSTPDKVEVKTVPINIEVPAPSPALPVVAPDIQFVVLTKTTVPTDDYVFFALNENDYLSFAQWLQEMLRYTKEQNAIIEYYKNQSVVTPKEEPGS